MQSRFIAGIKLGSTNVTGIIPVSSISNGQDFDFDSREGFIYYVEKINVSILLLTCLPVNIYKKSGLCNHIVINILAFLLTFLLNILVKHSC